MLRKASLCSGTRPGLARQNRQGWTGPMPFLERRELRMFRYGQLGLAGRSTDQRKHSVKHKLLMAFLGGGHRNLLCRCPPPPPQPCKGQVKHLGGMIPSIVLSLHSEDATNRWKELLTPTRVMLLPIHKERIDLERAMRELKERI